MKAYLIRKLSELYHANLSARRAREAQARSREAQQRLIRHFTDNGELRVADGVFKGLRYVNLELKSHVPSALVPKLLGSYEDELREVIEEICSSGYSEIIDVGCAEGYYAVGFALRNRGARVYAYDINSNATRLCREMAAANGVADRVIVGEACSAEVLGAIAVRGRALVMCDCEGFELELLDIEKEKRLAEFDFLVELHDFMNPAISPEIVSRFAATHSLQMVQSVQEKDPGRYPLLDSFGAFEKRLALAEYRPCQMQWAYLKVLPAT